jgi:hypothetical protein
LALLATCAGLARAQEKTDAPAAKPPDVGAAIERAFLLLVDKQESLDAKSKVKNEWPYEGVYREGGEIPIGYRIGGTAICAWLLSESPQFEKSKEAHEAVQRALDFVLDELRDKRMSAGFTDVYDVRGWGHTYALELMLRLRAKKLVPSKLEKRVDGEIKALIKILEDTEIAEQGGWNYARGNGVSTSAPSPFMTAPTLLALYEAKAQGEDVDEKVVTRALDALEHSRTKDGAIPYTTAGGRSEWPGAIGRSAITEVTLLLAGRSSVDNVRRALDNFLEHWEWLEKRRQQTGTHVAPYGIAPYYVFYAHGYAGLAIEFLPEGERAGYRERLLARLFQVREASGGWNDRVFPRSENFGTAMGLMALLAPGLPKPPFWSAPIASK